MFWQIPAALVISLSFLSQSFLVIWVDYKGPRGCFSKHAIILSVPLQLPGLTPGWSLDYLELEPVAQCCWSLLPAWPKFHRTPAIMHLLKPGTHSGTWCTASLGFNLGIWLGEANRLLHRLAGLPQQQGARACESQGSLGRGHVGRVQPLHCATHPSPVPQHAAGSNAAAQDAVPASRLAIHVQESLNT